MEISNMREKVNNTYYDIQETLIHKPFFKNAAENPKRVAVNLRSEKGGVRSVTYGELADKAYRYNGVLKAQGTLQGDIVAVALDKSDEYISAVMGVLAAGCAFLPMSDSVPPFRRKYICEKANVKYVITSQSDKEFFESINVKPILPDEVSCCEPLTELADIPTTSDAYIIFTSGTTGEPKGVESQHNAVYNTVADINERIGISENDSVFAVSEIDFDLSVYDIFGVLSVGGCVVISDKGMKKEPSAWKRLMRECGTTIWNSVPRLLEMLLTADGDNTVVKNLRVILVSGDWVYPELVNKIREKNQTVRFLALGGATEASIWSNFFEVSGKADDSWKSVPYGVPLHNQKFRIVDGSGKDCDDYEEGEIQIGGKGLARGYINMPELTSERFVTDEKGARWYKTGDKGKYWSDGNIEFLGRLDNQVKFGGYRVELDEITRVITKNDNIGTAYTVMIENNSKQYIASAAVPEGTEQRCIPVRIGKLDGNTDSILSVQSDIANYVMCRLLELESNIGEGIAEQELFEKLKLSEVSRNIYAYWLDKLSKISCIISENGIIRKGENFERVLNPKKNGFIESFEEHFGLLRDILHGKKNTVEILENDFLSPERMSQREEGLEQGLDRLSSIIAKKYNGEKMKIAVFGARTGVTAVKLMEKLKNVDAEFTLIDISEYFIKQAREKLANYECSYAVVKNYLTPELRNSFDFVAAVNVLHTFENVKYAAFLIKDMLKPTGTAFVMDMKVLPPLSQITAAIVEEGFTKFTEENRPERNNPMLTSEQWADLLADTGFKSVSYSDLNNSLLEFLVAEGKYDNISEAELKDYLAKSVPEYMIPEKIVFTESIPLNKNGKADKERVIEIVSFREEEELILPRTETEKRTARLWKDVLGVEEVGINQSFFRAGGDSLLATHFLERIRREFEIELTMKEMFTAATLEQLAAVIDEHLVESDNNDIEFGEI